MMMFSNIFIGSRFVVFNIIFIGSLDIAKISRDNDYVSKLFLLFIQRTIKKKKGNAFWQKNVTWQQFEKKNLWYSFFLTETCCKSRKKKEKLQQSFNSSHQEKHQWMQLSATTAPMSTSIKKKRILGLKLQVLDSGLSHKIIAH